MSQEWDELARSAGRKSVMSLEISNTTLDAETNRQIPLLVDMLRGQLNGTEKTALDFGAGAGRFTRMLASVIDGRAVGFDPCKELLALAPGDISIDYVSEAPDRFFAECVRNDTVFDLVFAFGVLGSPGLDVTATVDGLSLVLAPGGLLVVVDHMPLAIPAGRWWRFRPAGVYIEAFAEHGIALHHVGDLNQLTEPMSMLAGRRT